MPSSSTELLASFLSKEGTLTTGSGLSFQESMANEETKRRRKDEERPPLMMMPMTRRGRRGEGEDDDGWTRTLDSGCAAPPA